MVLPRVLTAMVLVPVMAAVVWAGSLPFAIFIAGVCFFCVWEFSLMAEEGGYPNHLVLSLVGCGLVLTSLYLDGAGLEFIRKAPSPFFILLLWTFCLFIREFARDDKSHSLLRIFTSLSGVVLLALFIGHFLLLRDLRMTSGEGVQSVGRPITFFLIITIWMVDTGAWFVGRLAGKNPLAPRISPKKSWEGAVGGTIIACAVAWFFREAFLQNVMGPIESICYALLISVTAQMSDLIESLMKRSFGAKDSSQLLPGHGGMLDRFDSFIFAAPFFYYALLGTGRFH
jgi:phosphatidate cytidylyltransferase